MNAANSSGDPVAGSAPVASARSRTSASAMMRTVSPFSLRDHVARRSRGRDEAKPADRVVPRHAGFGDRREVRRGDRSRAARHSEAPNAPGADLRQRRRKIDERDRHLAGDEIGHRGAAALVRHVRHVDAGHQLEELAGEMHRSAVPSGGERERARLRLGHGDQGGHRSGRRAVRHGEHDRNVGELRDRHEVLLGIVGELAHQALVDGKRARRADADRVAVGRTLRNELDADVAAGARPVLHHDLLPKALRHLPREQARDRVRAAPRRKRGDEADRLGRIRLSEHPRGEGEGGAQTGNERSQHGTSAQDALRVLMQCGILTASRPPRRSHLIRALSALAPLLMLGALASAQQLPGLNTGTACPPAPGPAPTVSETELNAKLAATQAELYRLTADSASRVPQGVPQEELAEYRTMLALIAGSYARQLDARDELALVQRNRAALAAKVKNWPGAGPGPHTLSLVDGLRESAQTTAQKVTAAEARLELFNGQIESTRTRLKDAEVALRLAEERAAGAKSEADAPRQVWARDLAAVRARALGAALGALEARTEIVRTELAEYREELAFTDRQIDTASKSISFSREDLDQALARIDKDKAALERETVEAQTRLAARREALSKAQADPAEIGRASC